MDEIKELHLMIVSPEHILFDGKVEAVTLPGSRGAFMVLPGHAPVVSTLGKGIVRYRLKNQEEEITVKGGFVEVNNDEMSVCVEV